MHIALLGRQPAISIAELERLYKNVSWFSDTVALVDTDSIDIQRLGGTQKSGKVVLEFPAKDFRTVADKITQHYTKAWAKTEGKITLGLSVYGVHINPRDIQKVGLVLKSKLKASGASLRLIPNQEPALSTATSHHNKLGLSDNKVELLIIVSKNKVIVAESTGAQNITALAARDQGRPKRDAFVGMLPPKLAQIMINLAGVESKASLLDPFCGTGVILQEALLQDHTVYGSDLNPKMIDFTIKNLEWLQDKYRYTGTVKTIREGDATDFTWKEASELDAIVTETYLGQPFSAPPSSSKLTEVRGNCNHIISGFLKNVASQIKPGTPVVLAVPAWKSTDDSFTHLPLVDQVEKLGYTKVSFKTITPDQLLYFRPDQVVAREILVLIKN